MYFHFRNGVQNILSTPFGDVASDFLYLNMNLDNSHFSSSIAQHVSYGQLTSSSLKLEN